MKKDTGTADDEAQDEAHSHGRTVQIWLKSTYLVWSRTWRPRIVMPGNLQTGGDTARLNVGGAYHKAAGVRSHVLAVARWYDDGWTGGVLDFGSFQTR